MDAPHLLIEPDYSIEVAMESLAQLKPVLHGVSETGPGEAERQVKQVLRKVATVLGWDSRTDP
jgi:hypothetical protein